MLLEKATGWLEARRTPALDVLLALVLVAVELTTARHESAGVISLETIAAAGIALRRRAPSVMAVVVGIAMGAGQVLKPRDVTSLAGVAALLIALYSVGAYQRSLIRSSIIGLALSVLGNSDLIRYGLGSDGFWPFRFLFVVAAWVVGWAMHRRVRERDAASLRADVLAEQQEKVAAEAVARERARLARELHDEIAHNVSVMVIQAAAAASVLDQEHKAALQALESVQRSGRQTILELRRLLGILRDSEENEELVSDPSLESINELCERVRAAGLQVELKIEGVPSKLPSSVDRSAFRIVQEGLTNVVKHAHAAAATVLIRYQPQAIELEVSDDGQGAISFGNGYGLVGVRERVHLFGGTFHAGARPHGGFEMRARLPIAESMP
ncbi:MAG: sensor histidine kinase [Actinomycetota bacterium]